MAYYNRMQSLGNVTSPVPSFSDEIGSLGATVDQLAARQIAIAQMEQRAKVDADKDAYYRRKLDQQGRREDNRLASERTKRNLEAMKQFRTNPGAGPVAWEDEFGKTHVVTPRFAKGKAAMGPDGSAVVEEAQAQGDGGQFQLQEPFSRPPGARPGMEGMQLRPPMFEQASPPAGSEVTQVQPPVVRGMQSRQGDDSIFLDEFNDGSVRGLTGANDEKKLDLAEDSFPPGAQEGDRFASEDVGLEGRKGNPMAEPTDRSIEPGDFASIFVDEIDDGAVRGLTGRDDEQKLDLTEDALPPGAREGQRFQTGDVGLEGRKGNPFGEAMPEEPLPDIQRQDIPEGGLKLDKPESSVTSVPPTNVQGAKFDMRQAQTSEPELQGDYWELKLPDGQRIVVDVEQQRQAKRADAEAQLAQIQEARKLVTDDPALDRQLALREAMIRGGLSERAAGQGVSLAHKTEERTGAQDYKADEADKNRAFQGEQKGLDRTSREKGYAMRKGKSGGGGSGLGGYKVKVPEGAIYIDIPRNRNGARPHELLGKVDTEWASYARDQKLNDQLKGLRRIVQAEHNISVTGKGSDMVNSEAFLNFAGATRGGVPVENEAKIMWDKRKTWAMQVKVFLARAGLGEAVARFMAGGELTQEEADAAQKTMSPEELNMMAISIKESKKVLVQQVQESIEPFTMQLANLGGPGGKIMRQYGVSLVNGRLKAAKLDPDYNPFKDTTLSSGSPFLKDGGPREGAGGGIGGGPAEASAPKQGGVSLKEVFGL